MKTKKFLSLMMALAMILALAVPAMATAPTLPEAPTQQAATALEHKSQLTGNTTVPTINLVIGAVTGKLAFNPYKIGVKMTGNGTFDDAASTDTVYDDQIISKPITITNLTNVPLKLTGSLLVNPTYTGSETGEAAATVSNKEIAATVTAKQVYVYADFVAYDDADITKVPADAWTAAQKTGRLTAAAANTAVSHKATDRIDMAATDGTTPNYVYVKLGGGATRTPATAWTADHKLQVDYTFTFEPQPSYDLYPVAYKNGSSSDITVTTLYSKADMKAEAAASGDDVTSALPGKIPAGKVVYITPTTGNKLTAVKFYAVDGSTAITTVKAASTNTKDPTAPWTFTMPAGAVVFEATTAAVT